MHTRLDNFNTYEDALTKALQVEMDEGYPVNPVDSRIEGQLEIMKNSIWDLNLKGHEFWCTKCSMVGHTKDNFRQEER